MAAYGIGYDPRQDYSQALQNQAMGLQRMIPPPPQKPEYNFTSTSKSKVILVKKKEVKLMPKNFDIETETIIKPLQPKREGVKIKRSNHMPRIYKLLWLAALTAFIFSLVANIDANMPSFFHWFIKH